jgi:predicted nucleotidyltransferase
MDAGRFEALAREHGIELIIQFGSTVSGATHAASDLDLAVLLAHAPESLASEADLVAGIQALVPGRDVDVAILNHADPLLLKQVTEGGVLVFGSPRRFQGFKLYAFRRYQDHRRFFQMEREYVARAVSGRP